MKLFPYMKSKQISPEEMAALVDGVSVSAVRKWMYEERVPRPDQMRRIAEVTENVVQPNDFILPAVEAAE